MRTFELGLREEHFKSIGKITVNFHILEQMLSFCIWSLIEKDDLTTTLLMSKMEPADVENIVRSLVLTSQGMEKLIKKKRGQVVTADLSFRQKMGMLSSLYQHVEPDEEKRAGLNELLSRVTSAEDKRNAIIRSLWVTDITEDATKAKATSKKPKGMQLQIKPLSVQEIDEVADFIAAAAYDVQTFALRIYNPNFRKA